MGLFFFQAEDGIRDYKVTGVQTCALPICSFSAAAKARSEKHCHSEHRRRVWIPMLRTSLSRSERCDGGQSSRLETNRLGTQLAMPAKRTLCRVDSAMVFIPAACRGR